jgi:hypothetical protein
MPDRRVSAALIDDTFIFVCRFLSQAERRQLQISLEGGSIDFSTFSDKSVSEGDHETMVKDAPESQMQGTLPLKAAASQRLVAKATKTRLQAPGTIHLGLGDDVVEMDAVAHSMAVPKLKSRVDTLADNIVLGD